MSTVQAHVAPASAGRSSQVLVVILIALLSFLVGLSWSGGAVKANPVGTPQLPSLNLINELNTSNRTATEPAQNAHIYFLLDRSGSMQSIASDVIGGFNSFVREQQLAASDTAKLTMTLIQFDSQNPHEVVFSGKDIGDVPPLIFQPRSSTPLYDALGRIISSAAAAHVPNERIVLVTFSDGKENASKEHSRKAIFDLIKAKSDDGWTFVFLGANQDSYSQAGGLGFSGSNTQNFHFDKGGVASAYASVSNAMSGMRSKMFASSGAYDSEDFFEGVKSAEADYNSRASLSSHVKSVVR